MGIKEFTGLIHPALAVAFVFPLIGMVVYLSMQTRGRRLQVENKVKSKIAPTAGPDHLRLGRWLTTSVVVLTLIGMLQPIVTKMIEKNAWADEPRRVVFVSIMFVLTSGSLALLYQAKLKA
ncbi:MAG: DUF4079 domain-containing protein, partial [Cyanobacteria bacterium P01_A01_bin.37]